MFTKNLNDSCSHVDIDEWLMHYHRETGNSWTNKFNGIPAKMILRIEII